MHKAEIVAVTLVLLFQSMSALVNWKSSSCESQFESVSDAYCQVVMAELAEKTNLTTRLTSAPGIWRLVEVRLGKAPTEGDTPPMMSSDLLHFLGHAVLWISTVQQRKTSGRPLRSVETGFAAGFSATALLAAAHGSGLALRHSAFDPFQTSDWGNRGLKAVDRLFARYPAPAVHFEYVSLPASVGLSQMYAKGECIDFAFMDDGHKFDDNMVELYFLNKMMGPGALLVMDDIWLPSVRATMSFAKSNLPFKQVLLTERFVALLKTGRDSRDWNHYNAFDAAE